MNLYLITADHDEGWGNYIGAVVAAKSSRDAKLIHPDGETKLPGPKRADDGSNYEEWCKYDNWVSDPKKVHSRLIGTAIPGIKSGKVILAEFNNP